MKLRPMLYIMIAVLLVGGLYYVLNPQTNTPSVTPQNSEETTQPSKPQNVMTSNKKVFTLVVKEKKLISANPTLKVLQGDDVTISITSDEADELHLHGYDESVELEKDKQASLSFIADKTGRFSFELEQSHLELGAVEVQPK